MCCSRTELKVLEVRKSGQPPAASAATATAAKTSAENMSSDVSARDPEDGAGTTGGDAAAKFVNRGALRSSIYTQASDCTSSYSYS